MLWNRGSILLTLSLLTLAALAGGCKGDSTTDDEVGDTDTGESGDGDSSSESADTFETTFDDTGTSDDSESDTDTTTDDESDTTETGDPEGDLACGTLASCVTECLGDTTCEAACVDSGSAQGLAEYDALVQCIVDNACVDDQCIEDNCGSEYLVCFTGDMVCSELAACMDGCDGDEICQASCYVESTSLAQSQAEQLDQCIADNMCADEQCIVENCGGELQSCIGGMSDELPCPVIAECIIDCAGDPVCIDICEMSASATAEAEVPPLVECAEAQMCNDFDCTENACPDEWLECVAGTDDCAAISACIEGCAGADICNYNCLTNGDAMAQGLWGALAECAVDNMCADQACLDANCPMEVAACEA